VIELRTSAPNAWGERAEGSVGGVLVRSACCSGAAGRRSSSQPNAPLYRALPPQFVGGLVVARRVIQGCTRRGAPAAVTVGRTCPHRRVRAVAQLRRRPTPEAP